MSFALPDCPHCDARDTLEHVAHGWYVCSCCAARVLLDAAGQIIRSIAT